MMGSNWGIPSNLLNSSAFWEVQLLCGFHSINSCLPYLIYRAPLFPIKPFFQKSRNEFPFCQKRRPSPMLSWFYPEQPFQLCFLPLLHFFPLSRMTFSQDILSSLLSILFSKEISNPICARDIAMITWCDMDSSLLNSCLDYFWPYN